MTYAVAASFRRSRPALRALWRRGLPIFSYLLIAGCAGPPSAAGTPCAGFLGDYSDFERRDPGTGTRLQVRDSGGLEDYRKVMLSPVSIYAPGKLRSGRMTDSDLSTLAFELDQALRRQMRVDYGIVDEAGPDVLRIRVALTRTEDKTDGISVFEWNGKREHRGEAPPQLSPAALEFLVSARCEYEVLDSQSGERLIGLLREPRRPGDIDGDALSRTGARVECDRLAETLRFQLQVLREGAPSPSSIQRALERHGSPEEGDSGISASKDSPS